MIGSLFSNLSKQNTFKNKLAVSLPKPMPEGDGKVGWLHNEADRWVQYWSAERKREDKNHDMAVPFDQSQWPDEIKQKAAKSKTSCPQFNIIFEKIQSFCGNALKNFIDTSYEPEDGSYTPYKRILESLYLRDKQMFDWERAFRKVLFNGNVYRGVCEMYIDTRHNELGGIGLRAFEKGQIYLSPNWKTGNGWDLTDYMKIGYFTPREMKVEWHLKDKEIDRRIDMMRNQNLDNSTSADTEYDILKNNVDFSGQKFKVVEYHYLVPERQTTKQTFDGVVVPDLKGEDLQRWYEINGIDPESEVYETSSTVNVYYVLTICPQLNDLVLEDRKHEIQIGRLPIFIWSTFEAEGRPYTLVDLLYDSQIILNKRESLDDRLISSTAFSKVLVDDRLFGGDTRLEQEFIENFAQPDYVGIMRGLDKDKIHVINNDSSRINIQNEIARMGQYADRLSMVTPAMSGVSESTEETGILFHRKQNQSAINIAMIIASLKSFWNEIGEAFLLLAQQHYDDVYMEFQLKDDDAPVIANVPLPNGEVGLKLSDMPRMRCVVTESPKGATQRLTDRVTYMELMNYMTDPVMRNILNKLIVGTLDIDAIERKAIEAEADETIRVAKKQRQATEMGLDMQMAQAQQMMGAGAMPQEGMEPIQMPGEQAAGRGGPQEKLNNINAV